MRSVRAYSHCYLGRSLSRGFPFPTKRLLLSLIKLLALESWDDFGEQCRDGLPLLVDQRFCSLSHLLWTGSATREDCFSCRARPT